MSTNEHMANGDTETGMTATRRERAVRFVDEYIDRHRELFHKLARE